MALSLPDARELSDEALDTLRLRAVHGRELGFSEADLAVLLGVTRETISRWWTAYRSGGFDALPHMRTGRPVGSGRILSEEQACRIQDRLDHQVPEDLGIPAPLWTRRAVRDLIHQQTGLRLPIRTVGEYLKRWGYTAKKPCRHARKQDPEEIRQWLEEDYPALEKRAQEEGARIFWCDETGAAADAHPARGYARVGQPVVLEVPDPHLRMNQISAVSNQGAVRFMTYPGSMNAALFLVFLTRLLRTTTRKLVVIVDRLRAHQTPAVQAWVARHANRIELVALPRRAPELNPDEYLNNDLKGSVNAEGLPDSKGTLRRHLQRFMRKLLHLPEHVKSYFRHPSVQYAAGP
jgi:transposase